MQFTRHSRPTAVFVLISALIWVGAPLQGQAQGADEAYRLSEEDWPCHGRYRLAFSAGSFWQGPGLDGAAAALADDEALRKLAERVMAPDAGRDAGTTLIEDFARDHGDAATRRRRLTLLFAAVLDEANLYRRFILEGIVGFVARRRLAADLLAQTELRYQALAADPSPAARAELKALEQRRFWQKRAFDSADGEARFLCHRLTSLEGKLGGLAREIAGRL